MGVLHAISGQHFQLTNPVANSTDAALVAKTVSVTAPNGDGVIPVGATGGAESAVCVKLVPFGVGSATNTFKMTVWGWSSTSGSFGAAVGGPTNNLPNAKLWFAVKLATYTCTLCTITGIANSDIGTTQKFCGTIVQTYGPVYGTAATPADALQSSYHSGAAIYTPTGNVLAMVELVTEGFRYLEVGFDMNSSATSANALWQLK